MRGRGSISKKYKPVNMQICASNAPRGAATLLRPTFLFSADVYGRMFLPSPLPVSQPPYCTEPIVSAFRTKQRAYIRSPQMPARLLCPNFCFFLFGACDETRVIKRILLNEELKKMVGQTHGGNARVLSATRSRKLRRQKLNFCAKHKN